MCSEEERPVTQAYADRRVQRPDWWPARYEWSAATINNLDRGSLDALFILMRNWKAAREVSRAHPFEAAIATYCTMPHQLAEFADDTLCLGCKQEREMSGLLPVLDPMLEYTVLCRGTVWRLKPPGGVVLPPQGPGPCRTAQLARPR